jgi:hypothetical protein
MISTAPSIQSIVRIQTRYAAALEVRDPRSAEQWDRPHGSTAADRDA